MERFLNELRQSLRTLRREKGFSIAALAVLALGIGATTAIFSVVNAVLLQPLQLPDSERLVIVCEEQARLEGFCVASPPNALDWADAARTFEALGVARRWPLSRVRIGDAVESTNGAVATAGFFDALGLRPARGRLFQPGEVGSLSPSSSGVGADMPHIAVISHEFWLSRFGGDPDIIGRPIQVEDETFSVAGVLPAGVRVPNMAHVSVWLPFPFDLEDPNTRDWRGFMAVGRLAPGVALQEAQAELETLQAALAREYPAINQGVEVRVRQLRDYVVGDVRPTLLFFLGAVGLLLLIACLNIANLLLARTARRETEFAVRVALGAARPHLARQILAEGLLLALAGGALGTILAVYAVEMFQALSPGDIPRLSDAGIDGTVLAFAFLLSLATCIAFSLAPIFRSSRLDPSRSLQLGRSGGGEALGSRLRRVLVVFEIGMALSLLVAAGLLTRTFMGFLSWEPGFERANLMTVPALISAAKYPSGESKAEFWRASAEQLSNLPGVMGAATASSGPLFGGRESAVVSRPSEPAPTPGEAPGALSFNVSPNYFQVMGIPLIAGRQLNEADNRESPPVALVNQTLARRYWSEGDAVGRQLNVFDAELTLEVVGVVRDVPPVIPGRPPEPEIYLSNRQFLRTGMFYIIRTADDPRAVAGSIRTRLLELEPDLDLGGFRTMTDLVERQLLNPRFNMALIGIFAAVAAVLAAVGLYGVISYAVATRTREIGVRMAIGADRRQVIRSVLHEAGRLILVGLILGIGGAVIISRLMTGLLYGVLPTDPLTYAGTAALLAVVAFAAATAPALRASRVDPMVALRAE